MCMVYATIVMAYRFVTIIMKVTAMMAIRMPIMMLGVSASPNTSVPTNIAVMGSKTPNTDAFVAPMLRVAMARVAVDMMVGSMASPTRLPQDDRFSTPVVISPPLIIVFPRNIAVPTSSA